MPHPRVGPIQFVQTENIVGFTVYGNDGRTAAHFGFKDKESAELAAKKMSEIIAMCTDLRGYS